MPSEMSTMIRKSLQRLSRKTTASFDDLQESWFEYARTRPITPATVETDQIIAGIRCRWFQNNNTKDGSTILYFHGGGLISGDIESYSYFASRLVSQTESRVLLFDYSLHQNSSYPAALEESVNLYKECINGLGLDSDSIVFGGDSAGARLMITTLCALRDRGYQLPRSAFSISGIFDLTLSSDSMMTRDLQDPCFSFKMMQQWLEYFKNIPNLADSSISPLFGDLGGLPPLLIQVGEDEIWHDDSKRLAEKVSLSGGSVQFHSWREMWHAWPLYPDLPEAEESLIQIRDFIQSK
jgi:monoterpene epsilon-lactone hydrolase